MSKPVPMYPVKDRTPGDHSAPAASTRGASGGPPKPGNGGVARALRQEGWRRGHRLPGRPRLRPAPMPLSRTGKDPPTAHLHCPCPQRRAAGRLADRAATRQNQAISLRISKAFDCINQGHSNSPAVSVTGDSTTTARDVITDYEEGSDLIDISAITTIHALSDLTITQS